MKDNSTNDLSIEELTRIKRESISYQENFLLSDMTGLFYNVDQKSSELAEELFNCISPTLRLYPKTLEQDDESFYSAVTLLHSWLDLITKNNRFSLYTKLADDIQFIIEEIKKQYESWEEIGIPSKRLYSQLIQTVQDIGYAHGDDIESLRKLNKYVSPEALWKHNNTNQINFMIKELSDDTEQKESITGNLVEQITDKIGQRTLLPVLTKAINESLRYYIKHDIENAEQYLIKVLTEILPGKVSNPQDRAERWARARWWQNEILIEILSMLVEKEKRWLPYSQESIEIIYEEIHTLFQITDNITQLPTYQEAYQKFDSLIQNVAYWKWNSIVDFNYQKLKYMTRTDDQDEKEQLHSMTMIIYKMFQEPIHDNREEFLKTHQWKERLKLFLSHYNFKTEEEVEKITERLKTVEYTDIVETINKWRIGWDISLLKAVIDAFEQWPQTRKQMMDTQTQILSRELEEKYDEIISTGTVSQKKLKSEIFKVSNQISSVIQSLKKILSVKQIRIWWIINGNEISLWYNDWTYNTLMDIIAIYHVDPYEIHFENNQWYSLSDLNSPLQKNIKMESIKQLDKENRLEDYPLDTYFSNLQSEWWYKEWNHLIFFDTWINKSLLPINIEELEDILFMTLSLQKRKNELLQQQERTQTLKELQRYKIFDNEDEKVLFEWFWELNKHALWPWVMALRNSITKNSSIGFRTQSIHSFLKEIDYGLSTDEIQQLIHIAYIEDLFEKHWEVESRDLLQQEIIQYLQQEKIINHNQFYSTLKTTTALSNQFSHDYDNEFQSSLYEFPRERKNNKLSDAYNCFTIYAGLNSSWIPESLVTTTLEQLDSLWMIINFTNKKFDEQDKQKKHKTQQSTLPDDYFNQQEIPSLDDKSSTNEFIEDILTIKSNMEKAEFMRIKHSIHILTGWRHDIKWYFQDYDDVLSTITEKTGTTQQVVVKRHDTTAWDLIEGQKITQYQILIEDLLEILPNITKEEGLSEDIRTFQKTIKELLILIEDTCNQNHYQAEFNRIEDISLQTWDDDKLIPEYLELSKKIMEEIFYMSVHHLHSWKSVRAEKTAAIDAETIQSYVDSKPERSNPKKDFARIQISKWADWKQATLESVLKLFASDQHGSKKDVQKIRMRKKNYPDEANIPIAVSHTMPIMMYLAVTRNKVHKETIECGQIFTNRYIWWELHQEKMIPIESQHSFIQSVNASLKDIWDITLYYNPRKFEFSKSEAARFSLLERVNHQERKTALEKIYADLHDLFWNNSIEYINAKNIFSKYAKEEDD